MTVDEAVEILWQSLQKGVYYPEALHGQLTLDDAYRVQLGVLARALEAGETQAGWKIGLTADAVRGMYDVTVPVFGYLLASRRFPTGHSFEYADLIKPAIESELCFTLKQDLRGPRVTSEQVLAAVGAVAAAFEIVDLRGNMAADLPLGVAENVSQWAYVTAADVQPYPQDLDLGQITAEVMCNSATVMQGRSAEVIDNQAQSIAWLANTLAEYGASLVAGQCILTGSFTKPLPVTQGDRWETRFSSIGTVSTTFR
jgi:2-keto-4-pentenoate hydratase